MPLYDEIPPYDSDRYPPEQTISVLRPYISDERFERMARVVSHRTRHVIPVVEGSYDVGNAMAILRTAEGLGYAEVHMVETVAQVEKGKRSSKGAEKWLDVHEWPSSDECLTHLRQRGYRVAVTAVDGTTSLPDLDFSTPLAVVFGNELEGVSAHTMERADIRFRIPMLGFVESYNVSVAAALVLYQAFLARPEPSPSSDNRDRILLAEYMYRSVRAARHLLDRARAEEDM